MADRQLSLAENVAGEFFVDSTCIDCDTCRQIAPDVFAEGDEYSYVFRQPVNDQERRDALRALIACPTASIGAKAGAAREAVLDFPLQIEDEVYYCGFNSEKSFGGNSYFVRGAEGNWLIDSPRYVEQLARVFDGWGGVRYIFLTHRDDVADAERYAGRFGSTRIIHRHELSSQPGAERVLSGRDPVLLAPGFLAIPTPGHTRGHTALLYRDHFLFTGDHLWWSRSQRRLTASRSVCWYSWSEQQASVALLRRFTFDWVLPGHGQRVKLSTTGVADALPIPA